MDIEVFKLLIYSYGFDAETIHNECFPSFRQQVIKQYSIEPNPSLFTQWLVELKDKITSFQIIVDDDAKVNDLILSLKADDIIKEKNVGMKQVSWLRDDIIWAPLKPRGLLFKGMNRVKCQSIGFPDWFYLNKVWAYWYF